MEKSFACAVHRKQQAEYVCPLCENVLFCETCKREHTDEAGHSPVNLKEAGLSLMRMYIQGAGGWQMRELARTLRDAMKVLEAGLLLEVESSCVITEEQRAMQKLEQEGKYAELYFYAKGLKMGADKNEAAMKELNKRIVKALDMASEGLEKVRNGFEPMITPQLEQQPKPQQRYKSVLAEYGKDEVCVLDNESVFTNEDLLISVLESTDMSNIKAVYIRLLNIIGDRTVSELAYILQANYVSAVYLGGSHISDSGAEELARAAFRNKALSMFCLWGGEVSDAGAKAVAAAALNSPSLSTFYLSGGISDSGARTLAEAMKSCKISTFGLWSDEISDSGATVVAETMMTSGCAGKLSVFFLGGSGITAAGAKKVADAVRDWPKLSALYFDGEPLSGETLAYVLDAVASNGGIRSVNLRIDGVSAGQMAACLAGLHKSGAGRRLKLRFECDGDARDVCKKCAADWVGKFDEFRIIGYIGEVFREEVILGTPQ